MKIKKNPSWMDEVFHGLDEFGFNIGSSESKEAHKKKKKSRTVHADKEMDLGV